MVSLGSGLKGKEGSIEADLATYLELGVADVRFVHPCIRDSPQTSEGYVLAPPPFVVAEDKSAREKSKRCHLHLDIIHHPIFHQDLVRPRPQISRMCDKVAEENGGYVRGFSKVTSDLNGL